MGTLETFEFEFDRSFRPVLRVLGVRPSNARVVLTDDDHLLVEFGRWKLHTPVSNIKCATLTGDYRWIRAVGVRMSLRDRGITFGTNRDAGVCIEFNEAVPAIFPLPLARHPGVTVTVADPAGLKGAIDRRLPKKGRKRSP